MAQRLESRKLLTFFFQLSEIVLQVEFTSSGRQDALVGRLKSCKTFFDSHGFQLAYFNGCMVGGDSYEP